MRRSVFSLLMIVVVCGLLVCDQSVFCAEKSAGKKAGASQYLFLQQVNDMCMIAPMINLQRLEKLLEKYEIKDSESSLREWLKAIPDSEWFTRRQWFGIAHRYLDSWHSTYDQINGDKLPHLKVYLTQALKEGPISPRFYDAQGRFFFTGGKPFKRGLFINLPALVKFSTTPYLLIDGDLFEQLGLRKISSEMAPLDGIRVPCVLDADKYYDFDPVTNMYKEIDIHDEGQFNYIKAKYGIDYVSDNYFSTSKLLGFQKIMVNYARARGFIDPEPAVDRSKPQNTYSPYMYGLYKLMLISLGLDDKNLDIVHDEKHEQYNLYRELHRANNDDKRGNPWSDKYLSRDNFLQYHLAEIFRTNKRLFMQARSTVNFSSKFAPWLSYVDFINQTEHTIRGKKKRATIFKDSNGSPYVMDVVLKYIPGPEQALAFVVSEMIRFLWYGTLSDAAFYEFTFPQISRVKSLFTHFSTWQFDDFVAGALKKRDLRMARSLMMFKGDAVSFVDTWREIVRELHKRSTRKNWISFDGHGWVISFDQRLINLQKDAMRHKRLKDLTNKLRLLDALGCTGIESSLSDELNSFYKRKGAPSEK